MDKDGCKSDSSNSVGGRCFLHLWLEWLPGCTDVRTVHRTEKLCCKSLALFLYEEQLHYLSVLKLVMADASNVPFLFCHSERQH